MKHIKKYLCLALLLGSANLFADCCDVISTNTSSSCCNVSSSSNSCSGPKTVLPLIMQLGSNLYTQYHKPFYSLDEDDCKWMCDLNVTYRYTRTHKGCEISPLLFGSNSLHFIGTDENPNDGTALIADYFGLARDTDTTLNFDPKIVNNIVDFQFATGGEKLWFQVNLPIMHSKWSLSKCATTSDVESDNTFQEKIERLLTINPTVGTTTPLMIAEAPTSGAPVATNQDFNAFTKDFGGDENIFAATPASEAYNNVQQFAYMGLPSAKDSSDTAIDIKSAYAALPTGSTLSTDSIDTANTLKEALSGFTFGDLETRKYNKFNFDNDLCSGKWKIADIQLTLGYDFCKNECHHIGAYLKAIIPTGTEINEDHAVFVFQPLIGNGRHFELGGGLTGHMELWNSDDKALDLNLDGYITHMFKKSSFRTFDLLNKPMTRYALMKKLESGDPDATPAEDEWGYSGDLVAAGDINATCVDVKANVRGEAIIDLVYSACNWQLGLGYAFSGKSKEDFSCSSKGISSLCTISDTTRYGLKGTTGTAILKLEDTNGYSTAGAADPILSVKTNNFIDDGDMYSWDSDRGTEADDADDADLYSLSCPNRSGLMESQIINKIFAHVDYTWSDNCWMPTLGIVGSVSFSPKGSKTAQYWDLGARLGCSF